MRACVHTRTRDKGWTRKKQAQKLAFFVFRDSFFQMREYAKLLDLMQTGDGMGKLVLEYHDDVLPYAKLNLLEFHYFVKHLPYKADPDELEFVSRPAFSIGYKDVPCDCDDKCVIVGSYMYIKRIPFRFVAVQIDGDDNFDDFHHVFPEIKIDGQWITYDATYEWMEIGTKKNEKKRKILFLYDRGHIF